MSSEFLNETQSVLWSLFLSFHDGPRARQIAPVSLPSSAGKVMYGSRQLLYMYSEVRSASPSPSWTSSRPCSPSFRSEDARSGLRRRDPTHDPRPISVECSPKE